MMRFDKPPQFCKKMDGRRPNSKRGPRRTPCRTNSVEVSCDSTGPDLPSSVMIKSIMPVRKLIIHIIIDRVRFLAKI